MPLETHKSSNRICSTFFQSEVAKNRVSLSWATVLWNFHHFTGKWRKWNKSSLVGRSREAAVDDGLALTCQHFSAAIPKVFYSL